MGYLLKISFNGSKYYGWAPQNDLPTISKFINYASEKIFNQKRIIRSSGRTDRYVHALSFPVQIKGDNPIEPRELIKKMNKYLPNDIRVNECKNISDDFHVRFAVKEKKYRYLINLNGDGDDQFCLNWSYDFFDLNKLIKKSKLLIGTLNFASFTAKENYKSFIRTINDIQIYQKNNIVFIDVVGEGFMRFMVRNIVGALLANNRGKVSDEEFDNFIKKPEKGKVHYKAKASGLYFVEVFY